MNKIFYIIILLILKLRKYFPNFSQFKRDIIIIRLIKHFKYFSILLPIKKNLNNFIFKINT